MENTSKRLGWVVLTEDDENGKRYSWMKPFYQGTDFADMFSIYNRGGVSLCRMKVYKTKREAKEAVETYNNLAKKFGFFMFDETF